ncbi:hypothetical protein DdX_10578 [Ditylenchus destructor]|uniref:Uncharacterized protein n=1 Tax=Ditylenchus destructor TaxID=166010 RepID=A0AAD4MZK3_9BILA|nr:hypothetical protein DdX_10578 [Ditylenchus destructor]
MNSSHFLSQIVPLLASLLFLFVCQSAADVIDQFAKQGRALISEAAIQGTTIRQYLRKCFGRTDHLMEDFITCFEHNVEACLDERSENMIQKVNITELLRLGVERIRRTQNQLTKTLSGPIKKIVNTAASFGLCVKDCFLTKNQNGFCFDRKDCQPLLVERKARKSLRQCTKMIDWKKEAGELCECSVKAGLGELDQYCPMLRLIGSGGGPRAPTASKG